MNAQRKTQILSEIEKAFAQWQKTLMPHFSKHTFENNIQSICKATSIGLIIGAVTSKACCYIGPWNKCNILKTNFGGYIKPYGHYCYWKGETSASEIYNLLKDNQTTLFLKYKVNNAEEALYMTKEICIRISIDTSLSSTCKSYMGYVGPWKICYMLKKQFNGIVQKHGYSWFWIGKAEFKQISNTVEEHRKSKRYQHKCNV